MANELLAPGSTSAEEYGVDMIPVMPSLGYYQYLEKRLDESPKHVVFDGGAYQAISKEILRQKQLKVQLVAVVYAKHGAVAFRLVRGDGVVVSGSEFQTSAKAPTTITCQLPFGDAHGCVAPKPLTYMIQGKGLDDAAIPVCRRFSLSFIYV